jgi:hypothetical protein
MWSGMIALLLAAAMSMPAAAQASRDGREPGAGRHLAQGEARGMKFEVYIRLKQGMSEAELLQRAGPPDYESTEGTDTRAQAIVQESVLTDPLTGDAVPQRSVVRSERTEVVKSWYYLPTAVDPFTTRVTLIGGRIANIERTKEF